MTWTVELEEDPATGDLIMPFPPDLLAQVGWHEGDTLLWKMMDGQVILSKKDDSEQKS